MATGTVGLVRQLCDCLGSGRQNATGGPVQHDDLFQYALRLLSSNLSPSVERDELHLVSSMCRELTRAGRPSDAAAFSERYHELSAKGGLQNLWTTLLFLCEVSRSRSDITGVGGATTLAFDSVVGGSTTGLPKPAVELESAPAATGPPRRSAAKQHAVNAYRRNTREGQESDGLSGNTMHEVSEAALLRDVLFVFQGIDGQHIRLDPVAGQYVVDPLLGVPTTTRDMIGKLAELGWLYCKVNEFVRRRSKHPSAGAVERALCSALQTELLEYFRLISVLEAHLGAAYAPLHGTSAPVVTLRRLIVWTQEPLVRMRMLAIVVDTCRFLHGGAIASALHKLAKHGDTYVHELMQRCLSCSIAPIFAMMSGWIYDGELSDPYHEFFIAEDLGVKPRELWERKYSVSDEMLPIFFPRDLAEKVLLIGKSINFIRKACQDRDPLTNTASKLHKAELGRELTAEQAMASLRASIDDVYSVVSKRLLEILFGKYKLMGHLQAMRRYLLLGQGDFIIHYMGMVESELDKPARSLHVHNFTSTLEAAVRATNAQYDDPDVLARLDVKFFEVSPGDLGWDVFSLMYRTDGPISPVFRKEFLDHYLALFRFLWRAKYMEFALAKMWSLQMSFSRLAPRLPAMADVITKCYAMHASMVHFVNQIQYYFNFEVLECSWDELVKDLAAATDLDQVIEAHRKFLKMLTERALLGCESKAQEKLAQLRSIFDVIMKFRSVQDELYRMAADQLDRAAGATQGPKGTWGLTFAESDRLEVRERKFAQQEVPDAEAKVHVLGRQFDEMVGRFLTMLTSDSDQSLRFLSFRIDFNERYKSISPEYKEACSPFRPLRKPKRQSGPSNLSIPTFTTEPS